MRWPWLTLGLLGVFLGMQSVGFAYREVLWLTQETPSEMWRWATGQWIHTDATHAFMNGLALLGFGAWVEQYNRSLVATGLALGMIAVAVWFFVVNELTLYVGLSGALNTLLVMGLGMTAIQARRANDKLMLVVMMLGASWAIFHISTELLLNVRWMQVGAWAPAPGAHAAGWVAGLAWWAYQWYKSRYEDTEVQWPFLKQNA